MASEEYPEIPKAFIYESLFNAWKYNNSNFPDTKEGWEEKQRNLDIISNARNQYGKDQVNMAWGLYQDAIRNNEFSKGGMPINKQMSLFQEGGLEQDGGTIDPVSGNDVPPGAIQEEVRDDVPARLSEGEFVFPADVVRYWGLSSLMKMRQEAKVGLQQMEAMGQMGNSEEAVIPDDAPTFPVPEIAITEEGQQPMPEQQPMVAKGGDIKKFNEGGDVSYEDVMGSGAFEIPALSSVPTAYINKSTGKIIFLPHDKDGNLMIAGGKPPAGYELASEADLEDTPEEVQTPQVEQEQVEDNSDNTDKLGNNPEYSGGGARIGDQDYAVKFGADGEVYIANEKEDRDAGFSSPQWMQLNEKDSEEMGFTGKAKDKLMGEASFGNSAGGWLGNPLREGAKKEAQDKIRTFLDKRSSSGFDVSKQYLDNLGQKKRDRQKFNDKYFGGIGDAINTVADLASNFSPTGIASNVAKSLNDQKVTSAIPTSSTSNNNSNNDNEEKSSRNSPEENKKTAVKEVKDPKDGKKEKVDTGSWGNYGFKEGGLASKKKPGIKYSKGGTVKRNKKGLATK